MLHRTLNGGFASTLFKVTWASILVLGLSACTSPKFMYGTYMSENGSTDLQLNSDGTWLMIYRGETADKGTFSVQGDKFTFETSFSCGADGKAAYTWAQTNGTLVLTVKAESDDPCGARRLAMNAIKFSPKP